MKWTPIAWVLDSEIACFDISILKRTILLSFGQDPCNQQQWCSQTFSIEARPLGQNTFRCFVLCCRWCSGYYQMAFWYLSVITVTKYLCDGFRARALSTPSLIFISTSSEIDWYKFDCYHGLVSWLVSWTGIMDWYHGLVSWLISWTGIMDWYHVPFLDGILHIHERNLKNFIFWGRVQSLDINNCIFIKIM